MHIHLYLPTLLAFPLLALSLSKIQSENSDYPKCSPSPTTQKPLWTLKNVNLTSTSPFGTPDHRKNSNIAFDVLGSVRPFTASCKKDDAKDEWYECDVGKEGIPSDEVFFKFKKGVRGAKEVGVNQTWTCWEDAGPTLYTAYGKGVAWFGCDDSQEGSKNCGLAQMKIEASEISAVA